MKLKIFSYILAHAIIYGSIYLLYCVAIKVAGNTQVMKKLQSLLNTEMARVWIAFGIAVGIAVGIALNLVRTILLTS